MFNYMVVLRICPLPPNWVANLGAPHLDVPAGAFFWGTFFGKCTIFIRRLKHDDEPLGIKKISLQ